MGFCFTFNYLTISILQKTKKMPFLGVGFFHKKKGVFWVFLGFYFIENLGFFGFLLLGCFGLFFRAKKCAPTFTSKRTQNPCYNKEKSVKCFFTRCYFLSACSSLSVSRYICLGTLCAHCQYNTSR